LFETFLIYSNEKSAYLKAERGSVLHCCCLVPSVVLTLLILLLWFFAEDRKGGFSGDESPITRRVVVSMQKILVSSYSQLLGVDFLWSVVLKVCSFISLFLHFIFLFTPADLSHRTRTKKLVSVQFSF
jgi:hypothetical protein